MARIRLDRYALASALGLLALLAPPSAAAQPAGGGVDPATVQLLFETPSPERFVPGEVIVKMKVEAPTGIPIDIMVANHMDSEVNVTSGGEIVVRLGPTPAGTVVDASQ
jgi:hypothetical protein